MAVRLPGGFDYRDTVALAGHDVFCIEKFIQLASLVQALDGQ